MSDRVYVKMTVEVLSVLRRRDGFTLVAARGGEGHEDLRLCGWEGLLDNARAGEWIEAEGYRDLHPAYGERVVVRAVRPATPATIASREGVVRILRRLPGVGQTKAEAMADLGLGVFTADPGRIAEFVSSRYREKAVEAWKSMVGGADLFALMSEVDLNIKQQNAIVQACGGVRETWARFREDVWSLAGEVPGVSFGTADRIARRLGVATDSPSRIRKGAVHYTSEACMAGGHTVVEIAGLVERVAHELEVESQTAYDAIVRSEDLRRVGAQGIGLSFLVKAESTIADCLQYFSGYRGVEVDGEVLREVNGARGLSEEQVGALHLLNRNGVAILRGIPGTGKTRTLGAFTRAARKDDKRLWLIAPTGKAVRRLSEAAQQEAFTIHRFVWMLQKEMVQDIDGVVCDEASMMDVEICADLLRALRPICPRIIFVGDEHQLPPVGPGKPFKDMIRSGRLAVATLTEIHRQEHDAVIPLIAETIKNGQAPPLTPGIGYERVDCGDAEEVQRRAVASALEHVSRYGLHEMTVLAPIKKGPGGVIALGTALQEALNPRSLNPDLCAKGSKGRFAVGDPVMHTRNDYRRDTPSGPVGTGLLHAMTGLVNRVRHGKPDAVEIAWEDGEARWHECVDGGIKHVVLGYALTWHRSQGSEWKAVTVAMTRSAYRILSREALYTAMTRPKKEVRLFTEAGESWHRGALNLALRTEGSARDTTLCEQLLHLPEAEAV